MNGSHSNDYPVAVTGKVLVLDEDSPDDVARAMIEDGGQKEPFYIFDMDEASRCVQRMRELLPRVQMFYAMKANNYKLTLKLAVALGLGFDCSSPGEITKVKKLNVNPRSIIYAVPTKTSEQLIFAKESGLQHTTVDTSGELKKLKKYWPEAKILLRVRVDGDSSYKLGKKFGCDFHTEATNLLEEAAMLDLTVIGVAFHVGSCCWSPESYKCGLQYARALFDHEARAGRNMKIVDIGGGFLDHEPERLNKVANIINSTLAELFPDPKLQIISEVGRYIFETSWKLYCSICSIRQVTKDSKECNSIYLNDGAMGTLRYFEDWYSIEVLRRTNKTDSSPLVKTVMWGPSCDSNDRVYENGDIKLPPCTEDDWLVFDRQGTYTFCYQTKFSSIETPQIRSVISSALWNKIKECKVFEPSDFIIDPDISAPLPSTMPTIIKTDANEYPNMPLLVS